MFLRFLIIMHLAAPVAAQVRVIGAPEAVVVSGGQAGASGGGLATPTLTAPLAVPTLAVSLTPAIKAPTPVSVSVIAVAPSLPASAMSRPEAPGAVAIEGIAAQAAVQGNPAPSGGAPAGDTVKGLSHGRSLFDGAAAPVRNGSLESVLAPARSLWSAARGFLRGADRAPSFPPKPDQKVRVAGKTYTLGRLIESTPEWSLHELGGFGRSEEAVLVFAPEARAAFEAEKKGLEALANTAVPHSQLKAAGDGVLVLVRRNLNGWETRKILAEGIKKSQANGIADLAAVLIRQGATADLRPDEVLWEHWRGQWTLKRGAGFRTGSAWASLSQLWGWDKGVPDRAAFLSGLRGRLGPESKEWGQVVGEAPKHAELRTALDELARRDAARAPPAAMSFTPGRSDAVFSDEILSPRALAKRLGYDPAGVKERTALHADDPGKLNTSVSMLEPKGGRKAVLKGADESIIRNELFMRKVVRAFFGAYFDTPGALAVMRGYDSYMVMEEAGGGKSWAGPRLSPEQRVALALLAHTFGLGDMNPGNLFYGPTVWLIDFEQALSRHGPVSNRIPDERILQELPWVDAKEPPPMEDFLPGIKAWRELFLQAGTQRAVEKMLGESGFGPEEISRTMAVLRDNAAELEWTIQADIDFTDGLRRR